MSWKPIVVGVDGSPESVRAATAGALLAERADASCCLVHAVPDYYAATSMADFGADLQALEEGAVEHGRALVTASLEGHVPPALISGVEVWIGRAAAVLDATAQRLDAELVVLGGKRHRGLNRIAGSTLHHAVRVVNRPVLATTEREPVVRRVLAAVDLSYAAKPTIDAAERWAALFGAELRVLNVVEPLPLVPGIPMTMDDEAYYRSTEQLLETTVWPLVAYPGAERTVRRGRAAAAIVSEVEHWQADLLVLGSHGRGWVDRLLVGSVSQRLLTILPAMTLVVPVSRPAPVEHVRGRIVPFAWQQHPVAGAVGRA